MSAEKTKSAPDSVLALEGELTIYTVTQTLARLRDSLKEHGSCELDLSGVTEIDSAGLQLLLWTRRAVAEQGGRFHLVGLSEAVAQVIALLQLEQVLGSGSAATAGEDPA
ncbi:STAS domain-containing protein [uncultured Thiocystis sp.]|jgi:anti-anti-sigma factor|uniref:STAS domain-containing protein n=1 Tax=uncultured Thiocystis sp. TaxID=1202134 RepID=UPI0025D0ABBD|nr:STAS domain-containing protein [uncultured Thiocystis sp.]